MKRPDITPGPYSLAEGRNIVTQSGTFYLSYGEDKATGRRHFSSPTELDRIARAIAALPELLEALEIIDEAFSKFPDYGEPFTRPNGWQVQPMAKVRCALIAAGYTV